MGNRNKPSPIKGGGFGRGGRIYLGAPKARTQGWSAPLVRAKSAFAKVNACGCFLDVADGRPRDRAGYCLLRAA